MVKKLLKHEFIYYFRTFAVFLPIVLAVGLMTRIFRIFDDGNVVGEIALFSSMAMFVVACSALMFLSTIIAIVRFYKNMYSAEGYLTLTLPVTHAEHIFVKLLAAFVCQAVCALTILCAGCITHSGKELLVALDLIVEGLEMLFLECGIANSIGFILEVTLLIFLSAISTLLLYYACITVGQTAKKNRIFMAVVAYFLYYAITQVVGTVFTVVVTVLGMSGALDGIFSWCADHPIVSIHTLLCIAVVVYAAISAVFWIVTHTIMTKKLNLE